MQFRLQQHHEIGDIGGQGDDRQGAGACDSVWIARIAKTWAVITITVVNGRNYGKS